MEPFFQFDLPKEQSSIIKVFGVGGGGSNAVNHMFDQGIVGVNFVVLNTDAQALDMSRIPNKIQLGPTLTQGLGAGANPQIGQQSAEESMEAIKDLLNKNTKMVFITAGMGGGTGTGAAPVVARIAREMGVLTVGIVTTPFWFEGKSRYHQAMEGIDKLREHVDTLLIINNDKIRDMYGNLKRSEAFGHANNILTTAAKAISEIITVPGEINVDFADVQTVMKQGGSAIMGCATAEGDERAMLAVRGALNSPLLNDNDIRGAKKVLVNITTGEQQVTMDEIGEVMEYVQEAAGSTDIILGACDDPLLGDKLSVTIIATGFEIGKHYGYTEKTQKTVYVLNDKKDETTVDTTPTVGKTTTQEPAIVVTEQPETYTEPATSLRFIEEEEKFSLFADTTSQTTDETNVVEFDVTRDEQQIDTDDTTEPQPAEEVNEITSTPTAEEDDITVYKVTGFKEHTEASTDPVEDRKKILASLSYRVGHKQKIDELEHEPAYKRKGIELNNQGNYSSAADLSRYTVSNDDLDRPEIKKNNSFLHDNVD